MSKRIGETDLEQILALARADFTALRHARIFVTGGTGYIGRWLVESFLHANESLRLGAEMVVLSRRPDDFAARYPATAKNPALALVAGEVRNFNVPDGRFTHAIHAATDVIAETQPLEQFGVIVDGTRRVLDFCKSRGVKQVLLLSSGAVYGRIASDLVAEDYAGAPATDALNAAYGIGKMAGEWLGTAYSMHAGVDCKSARVFAQVGPYLALDKQFAAGNFIRNALKGEIFLIKGDGTPRRSYMYGTDLAVWLWGILLRGRSARAYNVGSDVAVSIEALAMKVAAAAKIAHPDIRVLRQPLPGADYERYVPDITRAKLELGLGISVPLEEALQRTLDWYAPEASLGGAP